MSQCESVCDPGQTKGIHERVFHVIKESLIRAIFMLQSWTVDSGQPAYVRDIGCIERK